MAYNADAETSSSLKELKEVVFDLEWEISDQSLDRLSSVLSPLKEKWKDQKPYLVCFKIIENIGQYVKKNKHRAHPEAVKLLSSVYQTLENIDNDGSLSEDDRVRLVRGELEKYNGLKGEITGKPAVSKSAEEGGVQPEPAGEAAASQPENPPAQEEGEEREIVPTRAEDQAFPEAEQLLDDFFAEEAPAAVQVQSAEAAEVKDEGEAAEGDETVEFDLGGEDKDKKISNIFGVTEAELEAKVGEKLGFEEEAFLEGEEPPSQAAADPKDDFETSLDAIIDEFSREVISLIAEEVRKAVREEIAKVQPGMKEEK